MYIKDLAPCHYGHPLDADRAGTPLLAVGWIEHPHEFQTGESPANVLARFRRLRDQAGLKNSLMFRALHTCSVCNARAAVAPPPLRHSGSVLFIPSARAVYATHGALDHYIEKHSYLPPPAFVDALFACPDLDSAAYREALRDANLDLGSA